jgi:hypothetical protein
MKNKFLNNINEIIKLDDFNEKKIITILQELLNETINSISEEISQKPISAERNISIGDVDEELGVRYGIKRTDNDIIIGKWIFNLRTSTLSNILVFIIVKESFIHFFKTPLIDVFETMINFLAILWVKKYFGIKNFENPLLVTINRCIYPETISGKDFYHFYSLINLLFRKNIDFILVLDKIKEIQKGSELNATKIANDISKWIYISTIKDEDVIAPIIVNRNLVSILDYLIENGYDSKISDIAKTLNKHVNSIRHSIRQISVYYLAFWQANINYEKLKLHNYFLKISLDKSTNVEQLKDRLLEIPFLKSIYTGYSSEENILYSPQFIAPHIIAESLESQLIKFEKEKKIKDFTFQLIGERLRYSAISISRSKLLKEPTLDTFKKLLKEDQSELQLKKYTFLHQIRDNSPFIDGITSLDFNLLYFLSFLRQKYILGGRYGGWVHELPKFYEINNISSTNVEEIVNFLSQIEVRARRRNILSFSLYMRPPSRFSPDVLVFETPLIESKKELNDITNKLQIFSRLAQLTLHNRLVFVLPGISHEHPVKDIIDKVLSKDGIDSTFYTINLAKNRFVPLHNLFNYDEQKWKI